MPEFGIRHGAALESEHRWELSPPTAADAQELHRPANMLLFLGRAIGGRRMTADQKVTLAAAAERRGLPLSTWLLTLGLREANEDTK